MSPTARRQELVDAAARVFAERGVGQAVVSDIVSAAGVAQGTFYLYFDSKTDVVNAVVEQMSERIVGAVALLADEPGVEAVEKLLRIRDVLLSSVASDGDLLAFFHRPGNEAFHDRVSREAVRGIVPFMERVIEQGCDEGTFRISHADDAALFLAALLDVTDPFDAFAHPERLQHHIDALTEFALRGLGCDEKVLRGVLAGKRFKAGRGRVPSPPGAPASPAPPASGAAPPPARAPRPRSQKEG